MVDEKFEKYRKYEEEVKKAVAPIRKKVLSYLQELGLTTDLEIDLLPEIMAVAYPIGSYNQKLDRVRISIPSIETPIDDILASLAHEAGHIEQIKTKAKAYEVDAWKRGLVWARRWKILPRYREAISNTLGVYESLGREQNIIKGLRALLEEIS